MESNLPPPSAPQPTRRAGGWQQVEHPKATTAMVLGICSLVVCGLCGPFAWSIGRNAVREIDASGGRYGGRSQAMAGYVMGVIGSALLGLGLLMILLLAITVGTASV
jgi:hypothetical protein